MKPPQTKDEYQLFIKALRANEFIKKAQYDLVKKDSLKEANKWFKKSAGVKHYYDLKPEQVLPKVKIDVPLDWVTIPGLYREIMTLFRGTTRSILKKKQLDEMLFNAVVEQLLYKFGLDLRFYDIITALILKYPQYAIFKLFPFSNLRIADTTIHKQLFINIGLRTRLADIEREWKYIQARRDSSFFGQNHSLRNRPKKQLARGLLIYSLRLKGKSFPQIAKLIREEGYQAMSPDEVRKAFERIQKT